MNRFEIEMMRDTKKLISEIEDIIMEDKNTAISDFADKKLSEKYNLVVKKSEEIIETLGKMQDIHTAALNMNDYNNNMSSFFTTADEITDYFKDISDFYKEVLDIISPSVKEKMEKINEMISGTYLYSNQRISYNLQFQRSILIKNIRYLINATVNETWDTYRNLIFDTIDDTVVNLKTKNEELEMLLQDNECEQALSINERKKLKKILSYRDMEELLLKHGYKSNRQKGTSHVIYTDGIDSIPLPKHGKDINKQLAYGIQKEISQNKFNAN